MTIPELIEALEKSSVPDNKLDVAVEIALFDPEIAIRANSAGTKVIVTHSSGRERTYLARDYTLSQAARERSIALLRALHKEEP
jgi:hypothetical protein